MAMQLIEEVDFKLALKPVGFLTADDMVPSVYEPVRMQSHIQHMQLHR
jgi:hypothetical protein